MQELDVAASEKSYKYFQFFGFADGNLLGLVTLNGAPMHGLEGESANISNNAAQSAAKYGENLIDIEITAGTGDVEYALLGTSGDEDGFDADHLVEFSESIAATGPSPWRKTYRFVLEGAAFASLRR